MSVRGYADWKPKGEAIYWINRTNEVLNAYRDYWPLTVRQIFYRLVATHAYPKSEASYSKLTQTLSRARRAGYVPWEAIRDGGQGKSIGATYFADAEDFEENIIRWAKGMKLDRQRDQENVIELWCEAGGMVPILQGIAAPYSARVNSGGGYDSVTSKHRLAGRVCDRAKEGLKTIILHVGDFDGSGENMAEVLREDAGMMSVSQVARAAASATRGLGRSMWPEWIDQDLDFKSPGNREGLWAWGFLRVERVALTGDQVLDRNVETAPAKKSDSRTTGFLEANAHVVEALGTEQISAQLEALTPPELEEVIREAIEAHLDMDAYEAVLAEEEEVRAELLTRLERD